MVRKATKDDFFEILKIYESARKYMKDTLNPSQWGDHWPPEDMVREDIENGSLYVIQRNGVLCGVMEFHIGEEPCYAALEGSWLYDEQYATVHRIASNGKARGIFSEFLDFGKNICKYIRIDTHLDNLVMQSLIEAHGFEKCGTFFSAPERGWIAYEKMYD